MRTLRKEVARARPAPHSGLAAPSDAAILGSGGVDPLACVIGRQRGSALPSLGGDRSMHIPAIPRVASTAAVVSLVTALALMFQAAPAEAVAPIVVQTGTFEDGFDIDCGSF